MGIEVTETIGECELVASDYIRIVQQLTSSINKVLNASVSPPKKRRGQVLAILDENIEYLKDGESFNKLSLKQTHGFADTISEMKKEVEKVKGDKEAVEFTIAALQDMIDEDVTGNMLADYKECACVGIKPEAESTYEER